MSLLSIQLLAHHYFPVLCLTCFGAELLQAHVTNINDDLYTTQSEPEWTQDRRVDVCFAPLAVDFSRLLLAMPDTSPSPFPHTYPFLRPPP